MFFIETFIRFPEISANNSIAHLNLHFQTSNPNKI